MNIAINRYLNEVSRVDKFEIPLENPTLLEVFGYIKERVDATLTFDIGCKSGVCGCCGVRANGKEVLACSYKVCENDFIEPLKNLEVIKDLVCRFDIDSLKVAKSYILEPKKVTQDESDEMKYSVQANCILCHSCYSSCPVFEVNPHFLGPFALSRAYRYIIDSRDNAQKEHIEIVQSDGVWDCTLCGNCTIVCPEHIDPKNDINLIRTFGFKYGFYDPKYSSSNQTSFNFGFNPNF